MRGVFISYRRDDTAGYSGRLYDALAAQFGRDLVFLDIDSIPAGQNFVDVIEEQIASCSVVIVLIGKAWLDIRDGHGRRLDDPHDFVRLEVASAFRHHIPVMPVLVGGARMPRQDDLPASLAPLANLNAIEIFDQLFGDSVKRLVNALQPLVFAKGPFWPWSRAVPRRLRIALLVIALLATTGIALYVLGTMLSPDHNDAHEAAPPPSETLAGPDESGSPTPIKVKQAPDVTELPPVVEAAKIVMQSGSSSQVTGPLVKPRILWRADVTVGDAWHVAGIAANGTVYLYDEESNTLEAIRDGKEQWAYKSQPWGAFDYASKYWGGVHPVNLAPDGRVWLGDYCFNSRGEGGRVTRRNLLPDRATLRREAYWKNDIYSCRDGEVSARDSRGKSVWAVDLDGNCRTPNPAIAPQSGNIYAYSDTQTLFAISPVGKVLWTVKQACTSNQVNLYPLPNDDVIAACSNEPLYAFREGKLLWKSSIGATGWYWSRIVADASGNIFVGVEGSSPSGHVYVGGQGSSAGFELIALDKSGKEIWTLPSGSTFTPIPIGFDSNRRLYVAISGRIVSLSQ